MATYTIGPGGTYTFDEYSRGDIVLANGKIGRVHFAGIKVSDTKMSIQRSWGDYTYDPTHPDRWFLVIEYGQRSAAIEIDQGQLLLNDLTDASNVSWGIYGESYWGNQGMLTVQVDPTQTHFNIVKSGTNYFFVRHPDAAALIVNTGGDLDNPAGSQIIPSSAHDVDGLGGSSGVDVVKGRANGTDILSGGAGNDRIVHTEGGDLIYDEDPYVIDVYDMTALTRDLAITANADGQFVIPAPSGSTAQPTLVHSELLRAGSGNDVIHVSSARLSGADGGAGNDRIILSNGLSIGGAGSDVHEIISEAGAMAIVVGDGEDRVLLRDVSFADTRIEQQNGMNLVWLPDDQLVSIAGAVTLQDKTGATISLTGNTATLPIFTNFDPNDDKAGASAYISHGTWSDSIQLTSSGPVTAYAGNGIASTGDLLIGIPEFFGTSFNDTIKVTTFSYRSLIDPATGPQSFRTFKIDGRQGSDTLDLSGLDTATGLTLERGKINFLMDGKAAKIDMHDIENIIGTPNSDILIMYDYPASEKISPNNTIKGGDGNDIIVGARGSDIIDGGAGSDTYYFYEGDGSDVIIADPSSTDFIVTKDQAWTDLVQTSVDNDLVLTWRLGGDRIVIKDYAITTAKIILQDKYDNRYDLRGDNPQTGTPTTGNDLLWGQPEAQHLDGLTGTDTINYLYSTAGVTVDLVTGTGSGGFAEGDTYTSIEGVIGSGFDDRITVASAGSPVDGRGGNDIISLATFGAPERETSDIRGGEGYDILDLTGMSPEDEIRFADRGVSGLPVGGNDWVNLEGFEEYRGSEAGEDIRGSHADEVYIMGGGFDTVYAGAGNDFINLGTGDTNSVRGGDGYDTLSYTWYSGSITMKIDTPLSIARTGGEGSGIDLLMERDIEVIEGSRGDDELRGYWGIREVFGYDGDDTIRMGPTFGSLIVSGGRGTDTYVHVGGNHTIDTSHDFDGRDRLIVNAPLSSVTIERTPTKMIFIVEGKGRIEVVGPHALDGVRFLESTDGSVMEVSPPTTPTVPGTGGDDTLVPVPGGTIYDGLAGFDTVDYSASPAGVTVDLGSGVAHGGNAQGNRFVSIEAVIGSAFADRLAGSAGADHFTGGDGADQLYGREGNDVLIGGAGGDLLNGGAGVDVADYSGSSAGVTVDLAAGKGTGGDARDDVLTGIEQVIGSAYADVLTASSDPAGRLSGGGGNDRLFGSLSGGTVDGGGGTDAVEYGGMSEGVRIDLQAGRAELISDPSRVDILINVELAVGGAGNDLIIGSDGGGVLRGGGGDDALTGGAGNDVLYGDAGADSFTGGAGIDTVSYFTETAPAGVGVNLAAGIGYRGVATGDRYLDLIENVNGGAGNDTIMGNSAANRLYGYGGNDILGGGAGDELSGGRGNDSYVIERAWGTVTGEAAIRLVTATGDGNDTVVLDGRSIGEVRIARTGESYQIRAGTGVIEIAGSGGLEVVRWIVDQTGQRHDIGELIRTAGLDIYATTTGTTHLATELAEHFIGIGNATMSYAGATATVIADIGAGTAGGDALARGDSFSGVANLTGGSGADILYGDAGDNRLEGGAGNDVLVSGGGKDMFIGGTGHDTVSYAGLTQGVTAGLNQSSFNSIEGLIGTGHNDRLSGDAGNNVLAGGAGADRLSGFDGIDTADYAASSGAVIVDLATGLGASGDASGDVLAWIEQVIGSAFNDRLSGSDAEFERLEGGDGADMLVGRGGRDVLTGGAGADLFVYSGTADSLPDAVRDTITDFSRAEGDRIDLSRLDAIPDTAARDDFTFLGSSAFTGRAGELRVVTSGATSQVYADFDGDGIADFQIEVRTGGTGLVAADFLF